MNRKKPEHQVIVILLITLRKISFFCGFKLMLIAGITAYSWADNMSSAPLKGKVLCQRLDGIYQIDMPLSVITRLISIPGASYPRWSPDGKEVAFVTSEGIYRRNLETGKEEVVAKADDPRAIAWHQISKRGEEPKHGLLFSDGKKLQLVDLSTLEVTTLFSGRRILELDSGMQGERIVFTGKRTIGNSIYALKHSENSLLKLASGCSASLSPDGLLVTNNVSGHRKLELRSFADGSLQKTLVSPPGIEFDNQFWSNNQDWIAVVRERKEGKDIWLQQVSTGNVYPVKGAENCDRPDLFVSSEHF